MPNQEQIQEIFDYLYEYLNSPSTSLELVDNNRVHIDADCWGDFDLIIDPETIHLT